MVILTDTTENAERVAREEFHLLETSTASEA
jgi:hypothetical protein